MTHAGECQDIRNDEFPIIPHNPHRTAPHDLNSLRRTRFLTPLTFQLSALSFAVPHPVTRTTSETRDPHQCPPEPGDGRTPYDFAPLAD